MLDRAESFAENSGSGEFRLRMNVARGISIAGEWDLRTPATDYTLTVHGADDGEDVADRVRILDDVAFAQLATVEEPTCWMKLDPADRAAVGIDAERSVHPAALMLLEPHAVGVVKDSRVAGRLDVRAEMPFDEAVPAVMSKAFKRLSEPPPEEATVPVTVGIDAGRYASIRYSVADVFRAAKENGVDLLGSAGQVADEVADRMAGARIEINYSSFGDEVDIVAPAPDLILDMDFAAPKEFGGTPETCVAARQ